MNQTVNYNKLFRVVSFSTFTALVNPVKTTNSPAVISLTFQYTSSPFVQSATKSSSEIPWIQCKSSKNSPDWNCNGNVQF